MDLNCEVSGQGEPLFILHGLFGSLDNWHSIAHRLSHRFRIFAVDQRNHGRSPHTPEMNYGLMADDLVDLMHHHTLADAYVLGHSMGGKTAMELALRHPTRVRKLVVVDIAPHSYPPRHLKIILGMKALDLSRFESRRQMEAALAPAVADVETRQFLLKNVTRNVSGGFQWRIGLEELHRNYLQLTEAIKSSVPYKKAVLFIRGESSDFLLESDLPEIKALFPFAELRTIPSAGHLVHVQNPDAFVESVVAFLE